MLFSGVIRIKRSSAINILCVIVLCLLVISLSAISTMAPNENIIIIFQYAIILITTFTMVMLMSIYNGYDYSMLLLFPVIFSAFQNIILGLSIKNINSSQVKILLVIHFVMVIMMCVELLFISKHRMKKTVLRVSNYIVLLTIYSLLLLLIYKTDISSFFASYRNIITCILFYLFGYLMSQYCESTTVFKIVKYITVIVLIVGFYEVLINNNMWKVLNIDQLWNKKGIAVASWGLPNNFVSSEKIFGQQIRRMSSTFADPVNLGTFLFFAFMITWFYKKYIIAGLVVIACMMTVSKGALLGFLIFFCIYIFFKDKQKVLLTITCYIVIALAIGFLVFSKHSSTGSVFLHISGYVAAVVSLFQQPFGYGCGNVGVMATILHQTSNAGITESGLGAVIGQLGVVGLTIYISFFFHIFKDVINKIHVSREKILVLTLLCSILVNITFNEVALSPNSCGIYFIIFGLALGKKDLQVESSRGLNLMQGVENE